MTPLKTSLLQWVALPAAALALAACETTGSLPAGNPVEDVADVAELPDLPDAIEEQVTYSTSVERIPQMDGSILVVTTTRGSDGSMVVDEEVIQSAANEGGTRGIGSRGPASETPVPPTQPLPPPPPPSSARIPTPPPPPPVPGDLDVGIGDMSAGAAEEEMLMMEVACDPDALEYDFTWPPPEPSARVEIPSSLVVGGLGDDDRSVDRIQRRVEGALERAGYLDQSFYTIGCDGFAIITRMEQIGPDGTPVEDGLRFTSPGEDERWSLTGYLTRLFYAPPGFYRQIILAGTDEIYDEDNLRDAPDEEGLQQMFDAGSEDRIEIDLGEAWSEAHKLHALIYEFETQGTRNVKQRRPSPIPAERHVTASGIYEDLD